MRCEDYEANYIGTSSYNLPESVLHKELYTCLTCFALVHEENRVEHYRYHANRNEVPSGEEENISTESSRSN